MTPKLTYTIYNNDEDTTEPFEVTVKSDKLFDLCRVLKIIGTKYIYITNCKHHFTVEAQIYKNIKFSLKEEEGFQTTLDAIVQYYKTINIEYGPNGTIIFSCSDLI